MSARIALFFPSLRDGGVQRNMLVLARGFLAAGLEVDFVLVQARGAMLEQAPAGVRLINLAAPSALRSIPALVRYLRAERPSALLAAQNHINTAAIIARSLAGSQVRLVVSEHSHISASAATATALGDRLRPLLARLFYSRADAVVAISNGVATDLARLSGIDRARVRVIYNPIDLEAIQRGAAQELAQPWFDHGQPPVVLGVGRLAPEKDFATLLRAFALLRIQRPARLLILGEGPLRLALQSLAAELGIAQDLQMPGFVPNPFAFMARARVLCLTSIREGFGNVLVEALACGVQVVSTDCRSGPAEILEDGRYGALTPLGNPPALAEAIRHALDEPLPPELLRARATAFSAGRAVQAYREVLLG